MNVLSGGKFGHGFAAAGVTQAFAPAIDKIDKGSRFSAGRVAAAALVGGTASSLSGGKFANGAVTGAFSRLFNDEAEHGVGSTESAPKNTTPQEHVKNATKIVDKLLDDGAIEKPADYVIEAVDYIPEQAYDEDGIPMAGINILDKNSPINTGRIEIYPHGAITLDEAIVTYAHEIGHFNLGWSEAQAEVFGKTVLDVYKQQQ